MQQQSSTTSIGSTSSSSSTGTSSSSTTSNGALSGLQRKGSFLFMSGNNNQQITAASSTPASPQREVASAPMMPASSPQTPSLSRRLSLVGLALTFSTSSSSLNSMPSPSNAAVVPPALGSPVNSPSSTDSTPRGISDLFSIFKRERSAVWFGVSETEEMRRLDLILQDRDIRNELVMQLFANHSDWALGVRFISSYAEYQNSTDRKERHMKGRKILATFFQPGSMFLLKGIPEEDLAQVRTEHLGMVKTYLLSELVKVPQVIEYMDQMQLTPPPCVFYPSVHQQHEQYLN